MEFLEGMTLKDMVLRAPLELDCLVDIAVRSSKAWSPRMLKA
jgi:hypothetical protein